MYTLFQNLWSSTEGSGSPQTIQGSISKESKNTPKQIRGPWWSFSRKWLRAPFCLLMLLFAIAWDQAIPKRISIHLFCPCSLIDLARLVIHSFSYLFIAHLFQQADCLFWWCLHYISTVTLCSNFDCKTTAGPKSYVGFMTVSQSRQEGQLCY